MRRVSMVFQGSEYTRVLNMPELHRILNMPMESSVLYLYDMREYAWVIPEYVWLFLNKSEYTGICVNMPKYAWSAFAWLVAILILCLLERVVTFFNNSHKKRKDGKSVSTCDYVSRKF